MLKIGHRGAPSRLFENTIASFRKALELGADGIELDVHQCKSGELVVFHDFGVDRHTSEKGYVRKLTLAQLQALALPGTDERIPTLEAVLEALGKHIYYFIELKPAEALQATVEAIERYTKRGWKHLILISFQHEALALAPGLTLGATFKKLKKGDIEAAQFLGAAMILPAHDTLSAAQVAHAHRLGLQVIPWTVNAPADIRRMRAIGVDGIMSDYPDRL